MSKQYRIVVAMSGGVDSGSTAMLLQAQGHEVIGITMRLYSGLSHCCGMGDVEDARRTATYLGIPFYVINYEKIFQDDVISNFVSEYIQGRTPNPCILCNQMVKFDVLLKYAKTLNADYLATGHYARIIKNENNGKYHLKKAIDLSKDQSYVLFFMNQEQLAQTLFPLGEMRKNQIKEQAKKMALPVGNKTESQDICFVPNKNYAGFVENWLNKFNNSIELIIPKPGEICDLQGNVLGEHRGIHHYTIGQRSGLGIALGLPMYVCQIDKENHRIIIGKEEDIYKSEFQVTGVNWISGEMPNELMNITIKIRYRNAGGSGIIIPESDKSVIIRFDNPQRAITPGQAAVFYNEDDILGGGWIKKVIQ